MPKYKVDIDIHRYHTIEEIDAKNKDEAMYIAEAMYAEQHEDIIYNDQSAEFDFEVYPLL